jgi:hypothetical protein
LIVHPDLDETALGKLEEEPAAVEPEQYHTARATNTGVVMRDMTTEEFQRCQQAEKNYDRALARYTMTRKALNDQPPSHTSHPERRYSVRSIKEAEETPLLINGREPRHNIDTWLQERLHVVRMCTAASLPNITFPRAWRDFLIAVKGLEDTWATTQQATLFNAQPTLSLDSLVGKFGMHIVDQDTKGHEGSCMPDKTNVTVYGVRTSHVPRGGEMVPPHLGQHLLHLSRS